MSVDCCLDVYQRRLRLVRRMINKSATKSGLYTIILPDSSHSAPGIPLVIHPSTRPVHGLITS
jgi:hypothetical protein